MWVPIIPILGYVFVTVKQLLFIQRCNELECQRCVTDVYSFVSILKKTTSAGWVIVLLHYS